MRGALTVVAVILVAAVLCGMGNLGETPEGTVPKTAVNIAAHITDRSGVKTDVARFSMDGKVSLLGRRGAGEISILIRDLKEITFGTPSGEIVTADLLFKDGNRVQLTVPKSATFYGDTGYGAYWIAANVRPMKVAAIQ